MVELINNLKENTGVKLYTLNNGDFFERDGHILQRLFWDDTNRLFNCVILPSMEYIKIKCDTIVKPVNVTITVNKYRED